MTDKKSNEQTRQVPNKHDNGKTITRKDESVPMQPPGKPLYQLPTEPWPEKPRKK